MLLVVSASMGAGHDGAARELARRLVARGHEVTVVDFLAMFPLGIGALLRRMYEMQLRRAPWSYEVSYRASNVMPALMRGVLVRVMTLLTGRALRREIRAARPQAIVSTYPFSSLVLGRLRAKGRLVAPVATYLTDFSVHPLWIHKGVDLNLAVSPASADEARSRGGIPTEALGPLVDQRFTGGRAERAAVRRRLGIGTDDRVVLVVAGSWGVGQVERTLETIQHCGTYHVITVCGQDERLRARVAAHGSTGTVLGWSDDMAGLMAAADVLVENAGGLTTMEAFASDLAVVTYLPIAGHGIANARCMARAGVSRYPRDAQQLARALEDTTTRGPARATTVSAAHSHFAHDPTDAIVALASDTRVEYPLVAPRRVVYERVAAIAAIFVTIVGLGLTQGAEAVAAMGVGVAKPPRSQRALYLAIRVTPSELRDQMIVASARELDAALVVDASTARQLGPRLTAIANGGVEIESGGWGRTRTLPWVGARSDCNSAVTLLAHRVGSAPRYLVSEDPPDAAHQIACHFGSRHELLVTPTASFPPDRTPSSVKARGVYQLDGRGRIPREVAAALTRLAAEVRAAGLHVRPLTELR